MGLDVSHDAFSGSYSAFNRFRQIIAKAWGGSYPPHDDPKLDGDMVYFPTGAGDDPKHAGLVAFMASNDCEGSFSPEMAGKIADEMEALLPKIKELDDGGGGHIERDGGYYAVALKYIAGCRLAHKNGEELIYG